MARTQTPQADTPKTPDFFAYHVTKKGEKGIWSKVGASWLHGDGNGMTLQLESCPIGGRIVLRAPREETQERAA